MKLEIVSVNWMVTAIITILSVYTVNSQSKEGEKPGSCPEFATPTSDLCVIECNKDSECPGNNKCCSLISCGAICTSPLIPTTLPNQPSAKPTSNAEVNDCQNECDNSKQCGTLSLCIQQGCKRVCKSFGSKKPEAKSLPASQVHIPRVTRNCTDQCLRNAHCTSGFICVPQGCRNVCQQSKTESNNIISSNLNAQSSDCSDRCLTDIHCPFGYICIKHGCRKICYRTSISSDKNTAESNSQITRQPIPAISPQTDCNKECLRDRDCSIGYICMQQGCKTFCKQQQLVLNSAPKSSIAPSTAEQIGQSQGTLSTSDNCNDECTFDIDCGTWMHCRRRGCKRTCQHDLNERHTTKHITASQPIQISQFESNCQNECSLDRDCNYGFSCRQEGCRRVCKKDDTMQAIDKSVPATIQKTKFSSCKDQCFRDSDCSFGTFCLQKGCRKECGQKQLGFVTTTSNPLRCKDECLYDRDCDLGFLCIKDGCKRVCQNFKSTQTSNGLICEIECYIDTDCPVDQNCIQDGCNKFCLRNSKTFLDNNSRDRKDVIFHPSTDSCIDQCSKDSDCAQHFSCTQRGCKHVCYPVSQILQPVNIDSTSQVQTRFQSAFSSNVQQGPVTCKNECTNNFHCPVHSSCVQVGCDRTCENQQLGRFK